MAPGVDNHGTRQPASGTFWTSIQPQAGTFAGFILNVGFIEHSQWQGNSND
jgi:hypothetical protein